MISLLGVGVEHADARESISLNEMVFRAASSALADAGLTREHIDGVVLAASDQLDGRAISSMLLAAPAGGYLREEVKISTESTLALATAAAKLEAGVGSNALVVSWTKASESPLAHALAVNAEPIFARPAGVHPWFVEAAACGIFAMQHAIELDAVDHLAESLAAQAHREPGSRTVEAWPLHAHHIPPPTDGAVAVVLSSRDSDVALEGWAFASSHPDPTQRPPLTEALAQVTARAFGRPRPEFDESVVVETTDRNAYRLCMSVSGLGLVKPSRSAVALASGELPNVNRSGGLWVSNPVAASGLERIVHATLHLRQGTSQTAIAHSSYDMGGQGQFVAVLRRAA